jgi:hypothetical protein
VSDRIELNKPAPRTVDNHQGELRQR